MADRDWNVTRRWILALTAFALILRLVGLGDQLWTDEVLSLVRYVRKPLVELYTHFYSNNQHPLYSLLARATMDLFGESPTTLRLWAALFGAACIPALYALGTRVTTRREAFLAASVLAVSYHHVWFSQNARGYTASMLATLLCTFLLIRGIEERRNADFVWYGLVVGLGAYAHLAMVFVAVGHAVAVALYLLIRIRPFSAWIWPLSAFPLSALFTLAFHGPMLPDVIDFFVNKPSPAVGLATPLWAAVETVKSLIDGFGGVAVIGMVAVVVIAVVGTLGVYGYARTKPLALALFMGPLVITALGVMSGRGIVYPRFFFAVAGFAILLFVRGPFVLGDKLGRRHLGVVVVGLLIVASMASVPINYVYPKQDFEGAMAHVESNVGPGDAVVTMGIINVIYQGYYQRDWPKVWSPAEIEAASVGHDKLWLLFVFPSYIRHVNNALMDYVKSRCHDLRPFKGTLRGGEIYTCWMEGRPS